MNTTYKLLLSAALAAIPLLSITKAHCQQAVTKANYDLAERFSPKKVNSHVFSTSVDVNWFKNSDKFWYKYKTTSGERFYIVDPATGSKREIWEMGELASQITEIIKDPFDALHLPITNLKLKEDKIFTFDIMSSLPDDSKKKKKEEKVKGGKEEKNAKSNGKKVFHFEYDINTGKLTDVTDKEQKKEYPRWANVSPDGKFAIYTKNYNIWYMDMENLKKATEEEKDSTIVEYKITSDGIKDFSYGSGAWDKEGKADTTKRSYCGAAWSPDSKHFALTRINQSNIKDLWVINVLAQPRPKLETYKYLMPGEPGGKSYLYLFDFSTKKSTIIKTKAFKDQSLSIETAPSTNKDAYTDYYSTKWLGDNGKFYFTRQSRDLKRLDICSVEVGSDTCKVIISEKLNTYVESRDFKLINNGKEIIQWSERDGWAHLYLYDSNGTLKNRITSGQFHVARIAGIDEAKRTVYFTANGKEEGINPYYSNLYSATLDGGNLKCLTPKNFDNKVNMSDDAKYFVTNYSRVDTAPKSDLFDNTGRKIKEMETTDLSSLFAMGYKFPETFTVKAGDGITDLYGVMYKPFDFDSSKVYPIIEYVYPGPQTEAVNSSWSKSMNRVDRLAQLGFIVVTVGNRGGHPDRSKWYHNFGYGNLRDYGLEDKKVTVQQLAAKYKFIDGNKVGIHGHSGGGFMSTAAILFYPHFFKAAVSCAGNHDNNIYNNWWSEQHHGLLEEVNEKGDTTFKYNIATNQSLAANLRGHLLLVTGDIDNNVHPGNTIRVINALIRANKRFDILLLPGQRHSFSDMDEYFFWKMADHFCKYLIGDYRNETDINQMHND